MRTIFLKPKEIEQKWYIVDATGVSMGRLAADVSTILRGKNKAYFAPNMEMGDRVIIINAAKIGITGRKYQDKLYRKHSGYPGGLREEVFEKVIARKPCFPIEQAIKGMLPKGPLGRKLFKNVKVYAGQNHPHEAQQPISLELK